MNFFLNLFFFDTFAEFFFKMHVIIVAGGSGFRMNANIPKQFLEICGKPILIHSLMAFAGFCEVAHPVVVICPSQIKRWHELCKKHNFSMPHQLAEGGSTRFQSVKNGLSLIPDEETGLVAVHDGVRPLVSRQTIENCFNEAAKYGCAVPSVPVVDSVRELCGQSSRMLNRSALRLIQTPQVFDVALLKKAYQQEYSTLFTDCASVFESAGNIIHLANGNVENIKITNSHDLAVAEAYFNKNFSQ